MAKPARLAAAAAAELANLAPAAAAAELPAGVVGRMVRSRQALRASLPPHMRIVDERLRFRLPQLAYYFAQGARSLARCASRLLRAARAGRAQADPRADARTDAHDARTGRWRQGRGPCAGSLT